MSQRRHLHFSHGMPSGNAATLCGPGHFESLAPTATLDRTCSRCPVGTFQSEAGQDDCASVTVCGQHEFATALASLSSDTQCGALTECSSDEFESVEAIESSDRQCSACACCNVDEFYQSECMSQADAVCDDCTQCSSTEFAAVPYIFNRVSIFLPVLDCPDGEFEIAAPTLSLDRKCSQPTRCDGITTSK